MVKIKLFITYSLIILFVIVILFEKNFELEKLSLFDQKFIDKNKSNKANFIDNQNYKIIKIKEKVLLDFPVIKQYPELPRGCEVTSLAMLLQGSGVAVDKIELASKIKKDTTSYKKENGKTFFGHPNDGFIGDMYSYDRPGLGVYHKPIKKLAEKYLPNQIRDLTGTDFSELQIYLSLGLPVWIIINTRYKKLSKDYFEKWQTPKGEIRITYKEHSVLVTGYDGKFIYFNDPISGTKNKKVIKKDFLDAWIQMGRQAITYIPEDRLSKR